MRLATGGRYNPRMKRKKIKFIAGAAVILGAVMALAISSFDETKAYYQTVPELKAMGARAEGRRVRVAGNVVPGSIVRRPKRGVTGLDEALARDWQQHHAGDAMTALCAPLDAWVDEEAWRRALRSPDARTVGEAWRVLQLASWLTGGPGAVRVQGDSCTA